MAKICPPIELGIRDFDNIANSIDFLPGFTFDKLRHDLTGIRNRYGSRALKKDLLPSLTIKKQRDIGDKLTKSMERNIQTLHDAFVYTWGDPNGDVGEGGEYFEIPESLEKVFANLRENLKLIEKFKNDLTSVQPGPDPNLAFDLLIEDLSNIFVQYTGHNVTAHNNDVAASPSKFQNFAFLCCLEFKAPTPESFDGKLVKVLQKLRQEGRIPQNTGPALS
jgi:hypothetical protein